MKKASLLLCVLLALSACTSHERTAEETTLQFCDLLFNQHDLDKAANLCTEGSREKLRRDFKYIEGAIQLVEDEKDNHYDYAIVDDKSIIKSDSAWITVHSSLDSSDMHWMLIRESEQWVIDFNYDDNAIQKDLTHDVLNVMQQYVDSVTVGK